MCFKHIKGDCDHKIATSSHHITFPIQYDIINVIYAIRSYTKRKNSLIITFSQEKSCFLDIGFIFWILCLKP